MIQYDQFTDRFFIPMDRGEQWVSRPMVERLYAAAERRGDAKRANELLDLLTTPEADLFSR